MAKKPQHTEAGDEALHAAGDAPEEQATALFTLTLYITDVDLATCDRWGNPADCPQGRVTKVPGLYLTAEAPTSQHPCPSEPEAYLMIKTADPAFAAGGQLLIGSVVTVKGTITPPTPPSPLKLAPARPRPAPGATI